MNEATDHTAKSLSKSYQSQLQMLADFQSGSNLALLHVLLYLHDDGILNKDDLAQYLKAAADYTEGGFNAQERESGKALVLPTRQLAMALEQATKINNESGEANDASEDTKK